MSVFVTASGVPLVLEFPDDPIEFVREQFAAMVRGGAVVSWVLPQGGFSLIVNYGELKTVMVAAVRPEPEGPDVPIVLTSLAEIRELD